MSLVLPNVDTAALKDHVDSKYFSIAVLTWVIYEMLITTGDSIDLFWMRDFWSISKALFFINRITGVLTATTTMALNSASFGSDYVCKAVTWVQFFGTLLIILIISWTLGSRVYALWKQSRVILTIFFLLMSANFMTFSLIYGSAIYRGTPLVNQLPFTGCSFFVHSDVMWVVFTTTLIFETLSIVLITVKAWPYACQRGIQSPIVSLLLEDGVAYYIAFTTSKLFVVGALYVPTAISFVILTSYPAVPVASVAVNSLFIRLQRALFEHPTTYESTNADFSILVYGTSSSDDGRETEATTTIGGSNLTGRTHARRYRHHDELLSYGDVDVPSFALHTASTHRGSTLMETP